MATAQALTERPHYVSLLAGSESVHLSLSLGTLVLATACRHRGPYTTGEVPAVIAVRINWQLVRDGQG